MTRTTVHLELSDVSEDFSKHFEEQHHLFRLRMGVTFTRYKGSADRPIEAQGPLLSLDDIRNLLKAFGDISFALPETGGVHSAALSNGKEVLFFSRGHRRHKVGGRLIGRALHQLRSLGRDF